MKEKLTIYFDENPEDGPLESRHFDHTSLPKYRNLIEQGMEKDGRKFYKIYFKEEH